MPALANGAACVDPIPGQMLVEVAESTLYALDSPFSSATRRTRVGTEDSEVQALAASKHSLCCAECCEALPVSAFPLRCGNRQKIKQTHGRLMCSACVSRHFLGVDELPSSGPSSAAASPALTASSFNPNCRDSPLLSSPSVAPRLSPLLNAAVATDRPRAGSGAAGSAKGTKAYEVKAQRLKATKKQMRAGAKDEGNLLFVDLLHWVVEEVPRERLKVLVEDFELPRLCRLSAWGLPCPGCDLVHGAKLSLWRGRQVAAKSPAWMRSPPQMLGLVEVDLEEVDDLWATAPDQCKATMGDKVQFVTFDGVVIWGRDLGEDSGHMFRAFIADMQAGASELDELTLPPAAVDATHAAAMCTEEAWHNVLLCLSLRETACAALAFLSSEVLRASVGHSWDPQILLRGAWPRGLSGLKPYLAAAHATYLADLVFSRVPRDVTGEQNLDLRVLGTHLSLGVSGSGAHKAHVRSVHLQARPSALALGGGDRAWEGLLAVAVGREIKLIRRYDLSSCGTLALKDRREAGLMSLSPDRRTVAVVPCSDSGVLASEVHFYTTEEAKAPPVVATFGSGDPVSSLDFLHTTNATGALAALTCDGLAYAVATCGAELCQIAPSSGDVVACWRADMDRAAFCAGQAVSANEAVTLADSVVELWDVRTAAGLVGSVAAAQRVTSLDAKAFGGSGIVYVGDELGSLLRVDWRRAASPQLLWRPPLAWGRALSVQAVMVDRGCACLISGPNLTAMAVEPAVVALGCSDIRGRLSAVASDPGAWALATHWPSGRSSGKCEVVIVESCGKLPQRSVESQDPEVAPGRKAAKMYRKTEQNGFGQSKRGAGNGSRS
eukprot:CAMPEP_0203943412 /NCGR_PEP_ID=MMETSP0359-20131031/79376_1 /ASSEMBLY_ACC=CAM_ASM_000338 /TAXON_ID=268821 /ORGANISM="Scrippsiella Hangoei, Strain SHTV-5" /LENGTH=835 /DNA_ID=CAMNT_0050874275 /DNA_START=58 /DNA_END=2562 /DNA_ORIENTATION=-